MKLSVIVPVYNVAPYLRACLDSVAVAVAEMEKVGGEKGWAKEDCPLIEVICVDDGSTDGSEKILDEYADRVNSSSREFEREGGVGEENGKASAVHLHLFSPPSFRVIHQRNEGVSAARNAALKVAQGDWVLFVDADDVVSPDYFRKIFFRIDQYPQGEVVIFRHIEFNDGSPVVFPTNEEGAKLVEVECRLPAHIVEADLWGAAFRRELFPRHLFRPYGRGEDMLFVTECLCGARRVIVSSDAIYAYRVRPGSAMNSGMSVRKLQDRCGYVKERIAALETSGKAVDSSVYRWMGLNMTEGFVYDIGNLKSADDRRAMWSAWYASLAWLRGVKAFPRWTRLVIQICSLVRMRSLAWCLCALPHKVKMSGFHR